MYLNDNTAAPLKMNDQSTGMEFALLPGAGADAGGAGAGADREGQGLPRFLVASSPCRPPASLSSRGPLLWTTHCRSQK